MANLTRSLGDFLQDTRLLLGNAQTLAEVSAPLAEFGYNAARWAEGKALLQAAEALVLAQKKEYGEQFEASQAVQDAWAAADAVYSKTLKVARVVFENDFKAIEALRLSGSRKASLAGWLDQALFFYGNLTAQPSFVAKLGKFGYSPEELQGERALVEGLQAKVRAQAKETGEAQQATVDRDAAVKKLDDWVSELRTILRVALADTPQVLEMVGITVTTPGPKKKG